MDEITTHISAARGDLRTAAAAVARERQRSTRPSRRERRERLPSAVVRGSLDDGLKICLSLLESDPGRFEAAAVAWHRRWCAELSGVGFAESQRALSALAALAGKDPATAGRALRATCRSHGLDEPASVLDAWLRQRSEAAGASQPELQGEDLPAA